MNANEVTDGYPDPGDNTTLVPKAVSDERRRNKRRTSNKLGGHSVDQRSNARWMKSFLRPSA